MSPTDLNSSQFKERCPFDLYCSILLSMIQSVELSTVELELGVELADASEVEETMTVSTLPSISVFIPPPEVLRGMPISAFK